MNFAENLETVMSHYTKTGAFLTAKSADGVNTMTVSWGFIGFLWNKPYFIVGVRPQRYTKKIIDKAQSFTISVPFGTLKDELKTCGTKSGADIDKSKVVEFIPAKQVDSPVVKGCDMYYECKLQYIDGFKDELLPNAIKSSIYNKDDFHSLYFGEIVECYYGG